MLRRRKKSSKKGIEKDNNKNKHSQFVEESTNFSTRKDTEINEINDKLASYIKESIANNNINYERENCFDNKDVKNDQKSFKCYTQKSKISSILGSRNSNTHKNNLNTNNFVETISVDNRNHYLDFNLKTVNSVFKDNLKINNKMIHKSKVKINNSKLHINTSNQNMLNLSQNTTKDDILDIVKSETEVDNISTLPKKECSLKVYICIFLFCIVLTFLIGITSLVLYFLFK